MYKERIQMVISAYKYNPTALDDIRRGLYACGEYSNAYFEALENISEAEKYMIPSEQKAERTRNIEIVEALFIETQFSANLVNVRAKDIGLNPIFDVSDRDELFGFCTECVREIIDKKIDATFSVDEYKRDVDDLFPIIDEMIHDRGERADELTFADIVGVFTQITDKGYEAIDDVAVDAFCEENDLVIDWIAETITRKVPGDGDGGSGAREEPDDEYRSGYDWNYDDER